MEQKPSSAGGVLEDLIADLLPAAAAWGVVPAQRDEAARARYEAWLAEGLHAGMPCLTDYAAVKFDPSRVLPRAASLIIVALPYHDRLSGRAGTDSSRQNPVLGTAEAGQGRVARFSRGRDYHKVLQTILRRICQKLAGQFPDESFRPICDTVPLSERSYAAQAGLGSVLHNCLLGNTRMGTYFVLGAVVSSKEFERREAGLAVPENMCTNCGRCLKACPTKALFAPALLEVSRCISWLTIEYKGLIEQRFWPAIGQRVFGCDVCQDVCPLNRAVVAQAQKQQTAAPDTAGSLTEAGLPEQNALFASTNATGPAIPLQELLELVDDDEVRKRFAGTGLVRAGRTGLVRNAIIVAYNSLSRGGLTPESRTCYDRILQLSQDSDPVIRETAGIASKMLRDRLGIPE